ncbi:MAG: lysophospholipid acyltransferase family protein [Elusimicrobia bacterium]|nr:lysophospholipid acyltransferase family protein [Elusimicrobiota bacterium]
MWRALKFTLVTRLLWLYMTLVGKTTTTISLNKQHRLDLEAEGRRYIYALWHDRQAFFVYSHRNSKITSLVSPSKDGEIMARVLSLFGLDAARGSSRQNPARGLISLMRRVESGYHLGITPDGPLGPRHEVKPGALFLARKLGLPILPIANGVKRKLVFKSWDRFQFPLPFNRVAIVYGSPIWIGPEDSLEDKARDLRSVLNEITERADREACS